MLLAFDHVNLRTPDADSLADWYESVLGLKRGPRPAFSFHGHWLYLGDTAIVHLIETDKPLPTEPTSLEHFAFRARGLAAFEAHLEAHDIPFRKAVVTGTDIVQINLHDPAGNHLHVDFRTGEETGI